MNELLLNEDGKIDLEENEETSKPTFEITEKKPSPIHFFHYCRLLLSHLGLVSLQNQNNMIPLQRSHRLERSLKELDKRLSRRIQKIGVLYVKEDQQSQLQILSNQKGSVDFEEFVSNIGWEVDLNKHLGYRGGLDIYTFENGLTAPYYSDFDIEVIFHVSTWMPNSKVDLKQLHKKKHFGNDFVNIIWCENEKTDYKPETIISKFNYAHIIIYPLSNGLYRLQIHTKPEMPLFGIITDGMIVNRQLLPYFARTSAIMANTLINDIRMKGFRHPYSQRLDLINETIGRYRMDINFVQYYKQFILGISKDENDIDIFNNFINQM